MFSSFTGECIHGNSICCMTCLDRLDITAPWRFSILIETDISERATLVGGSTCARGQEHCKRKLCSIIHDGFETANLDRSIAGRRATQDRSRSLTHHLGPSLKTIIASCNQVCEDY